MNPTSYKAATEGVALADLSQRGRWRVRGADAIRFLHGQCTNEVNRLAAGQGCYVCFLSAKGKMRGDGVIYRLPDGLGIDTEPDSNEPLRTSLERFVIADDVQIEDVTLVSRQGLVLGPQAESFLLTQFPGVRLPSKLYERVSHEGNDAIGVDFCRTHRADVPCFEWFASTGDFERIWSRWESVVPVLDSGTLEILRVEAVIPRFGLDMDENTIPIEAGLESRAISYTKGCYIGQEVISRIHSLGHVNRHLCKMRLGGEALPTRGDKIQVDDQDIGQVTSAVQSPRYGSGLALGFVRREYAKAGAQVSINNQSAEVIELCGNGSSA